MTSAADPRSPRQSILLIAYHFPPSAAVGGLRIANFARCLASYGWKPHVLTIRDRDVEQLDPSRQQGLEGIAVHTAAVLPTLDRIVTGALSGLRRRRSTTSAAQTPAAPVAPGAAVPASSLSRRLRRQVLSFLVLPDHQRGWILPATVAAVRRILQYRIGWMMTSCPPYSGHLVGLAVKQVTGTKWVADFRDPWMTTGYKRLYPTSGLSLRIERWLESKVIEKADIILFNVERLRNAYRARYAHVPSERFVFIPNAISPRASVERAPVAKYETFTLCYTGSLYLGRSPEPIFQALSRLIEDGRIEPDAVRIELVGQCRDIDGVPTAAVARKYGLESIVHVRDAVPYAEALELMSRSHLALLFAPDLPFQIPAKVYDYLGAGTRILAIASDGGTADLVRDTRSGETFSSDDVDGITRFLHAEVTSRRSMSEGHAASLERFDVRQITGELVGELTRVAASSGAAR